jgi:K+-transporting ATPase ATPase A chain
MNMLLGEVVFGGLGTGLQSMIMLALVGVLLGGLMVGRTPEYLGKAITPGEAKLLALYAGYAGRGFDTHQLGHQHRHGARAGLVTNTGPHAMTEVLFAYA